MDHARAALALHPLVLGAPAPASLVPEFSPAQAPQLDASGHLVDGAVLPASGREVVESIDPATGHRIGSVVAATPDEVDRAVASARRAFAGWRATAPGERAAALRRAAAAVREAREQLATLHTLDTGRLHAQALGCVDAAVSLISEAAEHGPLDSGRALGGSLGAVDLVRREPRGVVAAITPWNDPLPAAAGVIAAALVTGNTVVHKPSERSPLVGRAFAAILAAAVPEGVLNVIDGGARTGADLVAHPDVDVVAHVGSSAAGEQIASSAGPRGAKLLLENGGSDVMIVDEGVDPVWAAQQCALGAFVNTGQLCVAVERVLVHERVALRFLDALAEQAAEWATGDPLDAATKLGPMVDERMLAHVEDQVNAAVRAGALVRAGGYREARPGSWFPATVLEDCGPGMAVWDEETFGPVAPVRVVSSFDEALDLAGRTDYGLAATVLTPQVSRALAAVDALDVGTVKVNNVFGGAPGGSADPRRRSGTGRGYGPDLINELTVVKTVHLGQCVTQ
ncbi:MAG: aldehyde dehydrogenase family protein [Kineosporiaceae bacterium]